MSAIITILSLVASVWIFFGYIDPAFQMTKDLKSQKASYERALESANLFEQEKIALVSKYNSMDPGELDRLNTLLPDSVDAVRLIIEVQSIANRFGMSIKDTKIDGGQSVEAKNQTTALPSPLGPNAPKFETLTFNFSMNGPYSNFISFLGDLEKNLRVVDIYGLSLKPLKGNFYQYDFKIKTYWLK